MSVSSKGPAAFDEFYKSVYQERWPTLKGSLALPAKQVERASAFAASGLRAHYPMDRASILAAQALEVQPGERILDMCAAPGGKSLILFEALKGQGELVANEISQARRARLLRVFREYVPEQLRTLIKVTGHDGAKWCLHEQDAFDRVLLDAPCSGERHLLADQSEMKVWSKARSKNLAVRQYALLASALAVVRAGGRLVYSTCSLSPLENDKVVEKLFKKRAELVELIPMKFEVGEPTEFGWRILPDTTGWGPMYISVLRKRE